MEFNHEVTMFTQIPIWVDELEDISDFQARLLGYVYTFQNVSGVAFPSNAHIAKKFHKKPASVQNAISDLYSKGYLRSELVYKEDTKMIEKRFLFVVNPFTEKLVPSSLKNYDPITKKLVPPSLKNEEPHNLKVRDNILTNKLTNRLVNNNVPQSETSDTVSTSDLKKQQKAEEQKRLEGQFEIIWKKYPKKSGKPAAIKAFLKAVKVGVEIDLISKKLDEYNQQIKLRGTDKQYIKNGSTWFNQQGWLDEYDLQPVKQQMPLNRYGKEKRQAVVPKFLLDQNKGI